MPGVKLFRNYRQEEACAQINNYVDYYVATKLLREVLEQICGV